MNADVFFTMGKTHTICQDYATVVGTDKIFLADGCSTSPHTDIGARLLCRLAPKVGLQYAPQEALPLVTALSLPTTCLDATLLSAQPNQEGTHIEVSITGDGVIVARRRDGGYTMIISEFPSGAPQYLSYNLCEKRSYNYLKEFGGSHKVTFFQNGSVTQTLDFPLCLEDFAPPMITPETFMFSIMEYDLILLLSDGVQSFHRPKGSNGAIEPVPVQEIVEELLTVRGYAGQFITRMAKRLLKDAATNGWVHTDDFSVAALYLGPLP